MSKRAAGGRAFHLSRAGVERLPLHAPYPGTGRTPSGAAPSFDACPRQMERKRHLDRASIDKGVPGVTCSTARYAVQDWTPGDRQRSPAEPLPSS